MVGTGTTTWAVRAPSLQGVLRVPWDRGGRAAEQTHTLLFLFLSVLRGGRCLGSTVANPSLTGNTAVGTLFWV